MIFPKGNSSHHLKRMGEFLQTVVKCPVYKSVLIQIGPGNPVKAVSLQCHSSRKLQHILTVDLIHIFSPFSLLFSLSFYSVLSVIFQHSKKPTEPVTNIPYYYMATKCLCGFPNMIYPDSRLNSLPKILCFHYTVRTYVRQAFLFFPSYRTCCRQLLPTASQQKRPRRAFTHPAGSPQVLFSKFTWNAVSHPPRYKCHFFPHPQG